MAVLTYQLVYYAWTVLETDELRAEADGASSYLLNVSIFRNGAITKSVEANVGKGQKL